MCGLVIIARENSFGYFLVFPFSKACSESSERIMAGLVLNEVKGLGWELTLYSLSEMTI
jgi:hypothetical protein